MVRGLRRVGKSARSLYLLEPMRLEDIPEVVLIEQASFTNPWPEEAFEDEIRKNAFSHPTIALPASSADRLVAGYCIRWVVLSELHVQNVAVHPLHRGRGLGRYLVEDALELGRRSDSRAVFLEVRESNTVARRLYVSMGFREVGKRKNYYSQPREHAILYRKDVLNEYRG